MSEAVRPIPTPRYDFYQTPSHLIVALYVKGYGAENVKEQVEVSFEAGQLTIILPNLSEPHGIKEEISLEPLYAETIPDDSSYRVLSTKIELKIAKAEPLNWPSLLSSGATIPAGPSSATPNNPIMPAQQPSEEKPKPKRKNWDKLEDEEEDKDSKDPNAGGEASLQKMFASIYKNADEDTRRAMIKSYTESGGTTLSTDWSKIGQEKTAIQPPDGMEARKY